MKKTIALLLALCLALALAACGAGKTVAREAEAGSREDAAFRIVGTWAAPVDLSRGLADEPETAALLGDKPILTDVFLLFHEDGSVSADVDIRSAASALKAALLPAMAARIEEEYGISAEEWEEQLGVTLEELVDASIASAFDEESLKQSFADTLHGRWTVEGGRGVIRSENAESSFEIRDGRLVFDVPGQGELVFTRR